MPQDQANAFIQIIFFVLLIGAFYLFILRPSKTKAEDHKKFLSELAVGDKVVTIGGIHGVLKGISNRAVEIEIASGVIITMNKGAIGARLDQEKVLQDSKSDNPG